jgi:uncharacterized protein
MTPDERQLITGLFDRMRGVGSVEKDRDAETLINQCVRQLPDSAYMLVQSVLVQEHALRQADQRIRELEHQVQRLEAQVAESRPTQSGGSFLGGLFGGAKTEAQAQPPLRGSVPVTGRPSPGLGGQPLGAAAASPSDRSAAAQPWEGGGFLRSALATAAGVTGGMLLADTIRGMIGASPAKAAPQQTPSDASGAPDKPSSQEANDQGVDPNDPGHDPHIQHAEYDADAGDWGGGGDFEI